MGKVVRVDGSTQIETADDLAFGAYHKYVKTFTNTTELVGEINFQKGPVKENGVNGFQNEELIAIVIDRLSHFQGTKFGCRDNAIAITHLEEALLRLDKRTRDREQRGVEGTSQE